MTRSESVGCARRHAMAPDPRRLLYRALAEGLGFSLSPLSGFVRSRRERRASPATGPKISCVRGVRALIDQLAQLMPWVFLELVVSCAAIWHVGIRGASGLVPFYPFCLDSTPADVRGRCLPSLSSLPPMCLESLPQAMYVPPS